MKDKFCAAAGVIGGGLSWLLGGWSSDLTALVICMLVDFLSGSAVALVFHKSRKTETGAYSSAYGFAGLCKKVMLLAMVAVGHQMDMLLGTAYIRTALCIGFVVNESLSILENAGLMGIPIPDVIIRALDVLQERSQKSPDGDTE